MTDHAHEYTDGEIFGGVDTHGLTHHAAVVDPIGRHLADREFPATAAGYQDLLGWMRSQGTVVAAGVEGTGAYGAELTRVLTAAGVTVVEVNRPDRATRRRAGKSDPVDAYAAAIAVASGRASVVPKSRTGPVEAIRVLRVARNSAVKARTQAINQIRALLVTAPAVLREQMRTLSTAQLIPALARLRPGPDLSDPPAATKAALRRLARRYAALDTEAREFRDELDALTAAVAPELVAVPGVGPETAAQLLITAGDNPHRLRTEATFAHLTGTAPIPASSGRTDRHRLNRSGDRAANCALYTIVLSRLRHDPRTRAYMQRRTTQGLSKKDIMRCLKRYVAREIYQILTKPTPQNTPATTT
jgi:transposase